MECKVLKHLPNDDMALKLLEQLRNEFLEIVQRRNWNVTSINELCCCTEQETNKKGKRKKKQYNDTIWGFNRTSSSSSSGSSLSRSHAIYIRLRHPHSHTFHEYHDIAGTMSHELAHCVHSGHSAKFYFLMEEIQQQHAIYKTKHIVLDAQNFPLNSSKAYTLGGDGQKKKSHLNNKTDVLRKAAEQRALSASYKLGTNKSSLHYNNTSVKEACLRAAEARKVTPTTITITQSNTSQHTIPTCLPCYSTEILAIWNETQNNSNNDTHVEILDEQELPPNKNNNKYDTKHEASLRKRNINNGNIIDLTSPRKMSQEEEQKRKDQPIEEDPNDSIWNCTTCTFQNKQSKLECEVCGGTKHPSMVFGNNHKKVKKGPKLWDCSQCTYINDETNTSCLICGFSP